MIQYGMDRKDLLYVQSKLRGAEEKAPRVIKNALNHTAKKARKELAAGVQAAYTVKSGGFNSRMKVKNATIRNPSAVIWVKDRTLTIGRFHTSMHLQTPFKHLRKWLPIQWKRRRFQQKRRKYRPRQPHCR